MAAILPSLSIIEGNQDRSGAEIRTMDEHLLLAYSKATFSYLSYIAQVQPLRNGTATVVWDLTQQSAVSHKKMYPRQPKGQSDRGNSSIEVPSFVYVKLTTKMSYHRFHMIYQASIHFS